MANRNEKNESTGFEHLFRFGKSLGCGTFGEAYKVCSVADNKIYALKIIHVICSRGNDDAYEKVLKEANIMMSLVHPNIIRFFETHESRSSDGCLIRIGIKMELGKCGDLQEYIEGRIGKKISMKKMRRWMIQLSSGLAYMHEKKIIHRDIKPQNIFLDRKHNLKIGDFGGAKQMDKTVAKTYIGTLAFMSPETRYGKYGFEADVYSLGCVFICMATVNVFPVTECGKFQELPPTSEYGETINDLIMKCVGPKDERPKATEILQIVSNVDIAPIPNDVETCLPDTPQPQYDSLSFHIRSSENTEKSSVQFRVRKERPLMRFHSVVGQNITLTDERRSAKKGPTTDLYNIIFTHNPVKINQIVSIEISETFEAPEEALSLISFGFTSTDPEELSGRVPESVQKLKEQVQCWTAVRYESLSPGSVFAFHFDKNGSIFSTCKGSDKYRQENQVLDPEVQLWAVFGFTFPITAVKMSNNIGSEIMETERSPERILRRYSGACPPGMKISEYLNEPHKNRPAHQETHEKEAVHFDTAELLALEPVLSIRPNISPEYDSLPYSTAEKPIEEDYSMLQTYTDSGPPTIPSYRSDPNWCWTISEEQLSSEIGAFGLDPTLRIEDATQEPVISYDEEEEQKQQQQQQQQQITEHEYGDEEADTVDVILRQNSNMSRQHYHRDSFSLRDVFVRDLKSKFEN